MINCRSKVCNKCGERKPLSSFKARNVCNHCHYITSLLRTVVKSLVQDGRTSIAGFISFLKLNPWIVDIEQRSNNELIIFAYIQGKKINVTELVEEGVKV